MTFNTRQIELLTPTFCAGANQASPEIRVPSIKGQLRWWTRAVFGNGKPEYDLFGGVNGRANGYPEQNAVSSPFIMQVRELQQPKTTEANLCPHAGSRKGHRQAIQSQTQFELRWALRRNPTSETAEVHLEVIVECWLMLGALGARSNRCAGSVWPVGYQPTVQQFYEKLDEYNLQMEDMPVKVLGFTEQDPEKLRVIATDTIGASVPSSISKTLGYVHRNERQASALKLKVGRFVDGYRIIAVADLREGRASHDDLKKSIKQLSNAGKKLGEALEKVF
jgi:CRISPR type III-B/RAMP module RAMP protein Cmr1